MDDHHADMTPELGSDHPAEDPRVAATLAAVVSRLTEAPDELTARRHLDAISDAVHASDASQPTSRLGRHLLRRSAIASAAAVVMVVMLAGGGLLPDPAQQLMAEAAHRVGVFLPQPADRGARTPAPSEQPPGAEVVEESSDLTGTTVDEAAEEPEDRSVDVPAVPARPRPGAAAREEGADRVHPVWDIHPRDRTAPRRGADPQNPDRPGPPVVDPPARVPTPTPGGARDPGPPAERGSSGEVGHGSSRGNSTSDRARDARRVDPPPPQARRAR